MGECTEKITSKQSDPYRATRLWTDIVNHFESGMTVGRHWRQFKVYADSFTGTEAVNFLLNYLQHNPNFGLSVSRFQVVQLLEKLHKAGIFEDVRGQKYNRESFDEGNSRLFQLCRSRTGPRSPFSYCRSLLNSHNYDDAGRQNNTPIDPPLVPMREAKFDRKENEKNRILNSKENDVQNISVKQSPLVLKENQSLFGALQSTLLPMSCKNPNQISTDDVKQLDEEKGRFITRKFENRHNLGIAQAPTVRNHRKPFQLVNGTTLPHSIGDRKMREITPPGVTMTAEQKLYENGSREINKRPYFDDFKAADKENFGLKFAARKTDSCSSVEHREEFQSNGGLRAAVHRTLSLWKKPNSNHVTDESRKKKNCFKEFESLLCRSLAINDLAEYFIPSRNDEENVFLNLNSDTNLDGLNAEEFFPSWLCLALRYLALWPNEAVGSLPKYSGFEKDVFQAVVDYFEDPSLEPIFTKRLCQVISDVLGFMKHPVSAMSCAYGRNSCMETSFGLDSEEVQTQFRQQNKSRRIAAMHQAQSRMATSSSSVNYLNPMSITRSGLDLTQQQDDYHLNGNSMSYLRSMPDISFMGKQLFDSLDSPEYLKEDEHRSCHQQPYTGNENRLPHSDVMSSKPVLWDRSQSIVHLPSSVYHTDDVDDDDDELSAFLEKSRSCAHLASQQNFPGVKSQRSSQVANKSFAKETSLFFLTRAASRGAVTASYRQAVDKNSAYSTPLGKSLFSINECERKDPGLLEKEKRFSDVFQLLCLLLTPSNRSRLLILLRFLNNLSLNTRLILDDELSVRQMVLKHFSSTIVCFDDEFLKQEIADFLISHCDELAERPKVLRLAAREFKRKSQENVPIISRFTVDVAVKDCQSTVKNSSAKSIDANASGKFLVHNKKTSVLSKPIQRLKSIRF